MLIVAEVAVSLVLLVGAGLVVRSFVNLLQVEKGFDARRVLGFEVALSQAKYGEKQSQVRFFDSLIERLRTVSEVENAAFVSNLPVGNEGTSGGFRIEGRTWPEDEAPNSEKSIVGAGYFETMRIPLVRGRYFTDAERPSAETNPSLGGESS